MGRRFVLVAAHGFESASYNQVHLIFRAHDASIGFTAGCNHFDGPVSLSDGRLVSHAGGTEMTCFGDTGREEAWLLDFITAKPRVVLEGDFWIRLIGDDATLVFSDRFGDDTIP